jgi:hypothetical protein
MGQPMQVFSTTVVDDIAMFATDRIVTGQDGASFSPGDGGEEFPARLAAEVFAADDAVEHVFVASNQVVARRRGGWDAGRTAAVAEVITGFFVHYAEE